MEDVFISGIGLISGKGFTNDPKTPLAELPSSENLATDQIYSPFLGIPFDQAYKEKINLDKRDARLLGPMMESAVVASELALEGAGIARDSEIRRNISVIVSCSPGERQHLRDKRIVDETKDADNRDAAINARSRKVYRASDFLMQIPNLSASNICMLNNLQGASRTLIGHELCGVHGVKMAYNQIAAGRSDAVLIGSSNHGQCFYTNYIMAQAGILKSRQTQQERLAIPASAAAFLLLESGASLDARRASPIGRLMSVDMTILKEENFEKPSGLQNEVADQLKKYDLTNHVGCTASPTLSWFSHLYGNQSDEVAALTHGNLNVEERFGFLSEAAFATGLCSGIFKGHDIASSGSNQVTLTHVDKMPSLSAAVIEVFK